MSKYVDIYKGQANKTQQYVAPINPIPLHIPVSVNVTKPVDPVKIATPDLLMPVRQDILSIDKMEDLLFQDIGGQEILNLTRNDLMGEEDIQYQAVSNLKQLYLDNNSENILSTPESTKAYEASFPIDFTNYFVVEQHIQNNGYVSTSKKRLVVTNATGDGAYVTYTTSEPHGLEVGNGAAVLGITPKSLNTTYSHFVQAIPAENQFTQINTSTDEYVNSNLVYVEPETGDLIVEIANVTNDHKVEVEVLNPQDVQNLDSTVFVTKARYAPY